MTPTLEDPLAGTGYLTVGRIATSAHAELLEAEHEHLGYRVAIKLLHAHLFARADLKDRMRIEAQVCASVRHENLLRVTDHGETSDGRTFLVMERLQGRTLQEEMSIRGALSPAEAVEILMQALAGLAAAHEAGVVHRDVTPSNLFLCTVGGVQRVKVLDFGLAKIVDASRDPRTPAPLAVPTTTDIVIGTPRYSSPEQVRAERDIDARTDVYSAGWILHALLTGQPPFAHLSNAAEVAGAHVHAAPPRPSSLTPRLIPEALDDAVMQAIEKRREARFPTAAAFRAALARIAEQGRLLYGAGGFGS